MATSSEVMPLTARARDMVYNAYNYFLKEADESKKFESGYYDKVQDRVAEVTGVPKEIVQEIINDKNKIIAISFTMPNKDRLCKTFGSKLDNFDYCVIRNTIYDFHLRLNKPPTLKTLQKRLVSDNGYQGNRNNLKCLLDDMGFKFQKIGNTILLMEKNSIVCKRENFIQDIQRLRNAGKNIVYADELYVDISAIKTMSEEHESKKESRKPKGKGENIVIIHAGNEKGFIPAALMIDECTTSETDNNTEITAEKYLDWIKDYLIPNLPPNSVLVIDSTKCHNQLVNTIPNRYSPKQDMLDWLQQQNIPYDPESVKVELYCIIKSHKEQFMKYKIDNMLEEQGHTILRLPRYHPDLNPIENIWTIINESIQDITDVSIATVKQDVIKKINMIETEIWKKLCDEAIVCENEYSQLMNEFDIYSDNFCIDSNDIDESTRMYPVK